MSRDWVPGYAPKHPDKGPSNKALAVIKFLLRAEQAGIPIKRCKGCRKIYAAIPGLEEYCGSRCRSRYEHSSD